jgi:hypothetical protein
MSIIKVDPIRITGREMTPQDRYNVDPHYRAVVDEFHRGDPGSLWGEMEHFYKRYGYTAAWRDGSVIVTQRDPNDGRLKDYYPDGRVFEQGHGPTSALATFLAFAFVLVAFGGGALYLLSLVGP